MTDSSEGLTVAEYFAGIGLVRMGLELLGWQVVWANDISAKKYELYKTFFPGADSHYIVGDIFEIDPASVPSTTLATSSFPCTNLSLAGKMEGIEGAHSSAFWGFVNILKAQGDAAPPIILLENVPGWLYSNKGADFRATVQALNDLGYVCDVFTLDALSFTPQSRLRVFLVGSKLPIDNPNPELLFSRSRALSSKRLKQSILDNRDLRWFYANLPEPPSKNTGGLSNVVEQINDQDERWWDDEKVNRHLAMMEETHYNRVAQLVAQGQTAYRTFYRRVRKGQQRSEVRRDELSGCLRTAIGGSGKQFLIKAGSGGVKMRTMTPREYARLQGVPDEYPITVNGSQALTGFGDAVCVPAISWIAKKVLNPLVEKYLDATTQLE